LSTLMGYERSAAALPCLFFALRESNIDARTCLFLGEAEFDPMPEGDKRYFNRIGSRISHRRSKRLQSRWDDSEVQRARRCAERSRFVAARMNFIPTNTIYRRCPDRRALPFSRSIRPACTLKRGPALAHRWSSAEVNINSGKYRGRVACFVSRVFRFQDRIIDPHHLSSARKEKREKERRRGARVALNNT